MLFRYPADHPVYTRALEIERRPDISAMRCPYRSRQVALYMAMSEAAGRDPAAVDLSSPSFEFLSYRTIEELRKATGLDYVTMANFCGAVFREKRERESRK